MLLHVLCALPIGHMRRLERILPDGSARLEAVRGPLANALAGQTWDLLLIDRSRLRGRAAVFMERLRQAPGSPETIVLCQQEDPQDRAALLAAGVLAVLDHALADTALRDALQTMFDRCREQLAMRLRAPSGDQPHGLSDFVSDSPVMQRFVELVHKVVDSDSSLLVLGETGVGKERLARAVHDEGPRHGGPFVAVNCGAMPEALLESELFGHEQGAFTGAVRAHRGVFELAHGGTLFLDEVGEMTPALQVRLLRALQERSIRPVGAERDLPVDVRVIAATNRDLVADVRAGRFRTDLFYRLGVVALTIPPLRERRADIPQLARNHLEVLCTRFHRPPCELAPDAMAALMRHDWPGNVRELVNALERAVLLGDGRTLTLQDLPETIARAASTAPDRDATREELFKRPLRQALAQLVSNFEHDYLQHLLRASGGRIGVSAKKAGISPRALFTKMQRLGLKKEPFRGVADNGNAAEA